MIFQGPYFLWRPMMQFPYASRHSEISKSLTQLNIYSLVFDDLIQQWFWPILLQLICTGLEVSSKNQHTHTYYANLRNNKHCMKDETLYFQIPSTNISVLHMNSFQVCFPIPGFQPTIRTWRPSFESWPVFSEAWGYIIPFLYTAWADIYCQPNWQP